MPEQTPTGPQRKQRPFLGVHFVNCRTYGRLYLNAEGSAFVGRCPRCGATIRARVGENGTDQRFFLASCGR